MGMIDSVILLKNWLFNTSDLSLAK